MKISTEGKIKIARLLSHFIVTVRSWFGLSPMTRVKRRGVKWSLDLREGIDLAIYLNVYEPETLNSFQSLIKPGDVVLDIGANIGAMTLPLAKAVGEIGQVISFEPTTWAYEKLQRNLTLNPQLTTRVQAEQIMLLDRGENPPALVYSSWDLTAEVDKNPSIHPLHQGKLMTTDGVQGISLDEYCEQQRIEKIDLIKLDVDGYELTVLNGARKTLRKYRPKIIMEMALYVQEERKQIDDLLLSLQEADYQLVQLTNRQPIAMNQAALEKLCHKAGGINILAIPEP